MFRRLAVTLALLSASAQADDFEDIARSRACSARASGSASSSDRNAASDDLLLRTDGSIAAALPAGRGVDSRVPWSLVRLVLGDVDDDAGERDDPAWLPLAPSARASATLDPRARNREALTPLSRLGGTAIVDARGDVLGVVRAALVSSATGRVVALAVDVGAYLRAESRTIAIPWDWLSLSHDTSAPLRIRDDFDARWIQSAPSVELGS